MLDVAIALGPLVLVAFLAGFFVGRVVERRDWKRRERFFGLGLVAEQDRRLRGH